MRDLGYFETLQLLQDLGELTEDIVLVGGQALNFWCGHYSATEPTLSVAAPFTSKDIDFCGSRVTVVNCAKRLGGSSCLPTMDDAQASSGLVKFTDRNGDVRQLDFLNSPYGLTAAEVRRLSIPIEIPATGMSFRVLNPIMMMEGRVHNCIGLRRDTPREMDRLRASIVCARAYLRTLLEEGEVKAAGRLSERVFQFSKSHPNARTLYDRYAIDPFDVVTPDRRLPPKFQSVRYPQMSRWLAEDRSRRARAPNGVRSAQTATAG